MTDPLEDWIVELSTALGVDPAAIDRELLLDLSRAAHDVARAGSPITMVIVGMAAGLGGGDREAVNEAVTRAKRLAVVVSARTSRS